MLRGFRVSYPLALRLSRAFETTSLTDTSMIRPGKLTVST